METETKESKLPSELIKEAKSLLVRAMNHPKVSGNAFTKECVWAIIKSLDKAYKLIKNSEI